MTCRLIQLFLPLTLIVSCVRGGIGVDGTAISIEARIGQTKADVSPSGMFLWSKGDRFDAFTTDGGRTSFSLEGNGGRSSGIFSAMLGKGVSLAGVAVYPEGNHSLSSGKLEYNLPPRFSIVDNPLKVPMAAIFESDASSISFRHIAGLLKFELRDIPVGAAQFSVTANGLRITGKFTLDLSGNDSLKAEESAAGNTVTIVFPRVTNSWTSTFYVPVPCGDYDSFTYTLKDAAGKVLASKTSGEVHVSRASINTMPSMSGAPQDIANYSLVYPASASEYMKTGIRNFKAQILASTGVDLELKDDSNPPTGAEILVGDTSRPESKAYISTLADYCAGMSICGENGSIVLAGKDEGLTCYAMYQFEARVLSGGSDHQGGIVISPADCFDCCLGHNLCIRDLVPFGTERISIRTQLVGKTISVSGYSSQGGCSDGTYFYAGFTDNKPNGSANGGINCVIVKSLLSDCSHVATSAPYVGNHVNSLTYCSDNGYIYSLTNNFDDIVRLDPVTLKEVDRVQFHDEEGKIKPITAIGYEPVRKNFILRSGVNMYVADLDLKLLLHGYRANSDFVRQGGGCDHLYTYFPVSPTSDTPAENRLMVYDWNCVFQGYISIPLTAESEDMFVVGDRYYVNFAGSRCTLYELKINPVYIQCQEN